MSKIINVTVVGSGMSTQTFHVPLILALPKVFKLHGVLERKAAQDPELKQSGGTVGSRFGLGGNLAFDEHEGLVRAQVRLESAEATVYLHGAHVTH